MWSNTLNVGKIEQRFRTLQLQIFSLYIIYKKTKTVIFSTAYELRIPILVTSLIVSIILITITMIKHNARQYASGLRLLIIVMTS